MSFDLIINILLTVFIVIVVPVYYKNYGLANFLWLSDIGLLMTLCALWFKSKLLISMAVVGILPLELFWNIDFFIELFTGYSISGLSHYMFDNKYRYTLRALSLFHVFMPIIWIYYLLKWGYDTQAFIYFLFLFWAILILSYFFTTPEANINWTCPPKRYGDVLYKLLDSDAKAGVLLPKKFKKLNKLTWLLLLAVGLPLMVFLPMHILLKMYFS